MSRHSFGGAVHGRNDRLIDFFAVLAPRLIDAPPEPAEDLSWQDLALCAETDPEIFFVGKGESPRPAKRVCGACEVRAECLAYALRHDERFGVWGGLSERERRRLKRQSPPVPQLREAVA